MIFQCYSFIEGYIVLDLAVVTDDYIVAYIHILPKRTVPADFGSCWI